MQSACHCILQSLFPSPGCNRENFGGGGGGGGGTFAVLPVLLNHLTESTFPSPTCSSLLFSEILNTLNHRIQL